MSNSMDTSNPPVSVMAHEDVIVALSLCSRARQGEYLNRTELAIPATARRKCLAKMEGLADQVGMLPLRVAFDAKLRSQTGSRGFDGDTGE